MLKIITLCLMLSTTVWASPKASESTESFLKKCFKDYAVAFSKPAKESEKQSAKIRKQCLSKGFLDNWKRLIEKTDADAFVLAQDYQQSWLTDVQVKDNNESFQMAKVILGKGSEEHCLLVKYVSEKSVKIASVVKCKK